MNFIKHNKKDHQLITLLLSILVLLFFTNCGSDSEIDTMTEKSYKLTLRDSFNGQFIALDTTIEIYNGHTFDIEIIDEINNFVSLDLLELRNKSNSEIEIIRFDDKLRLKTESYTNENVSFDVYYSDKKLMTLNLVVNVLYKIKKDGIDLSGEQKLTFVDNSTPIDLEIYRLDGKELEGFRPFESIEFKDETMLTISNFNVFSGSNFKLIFTPFSNDQTSTKVSLYYSSFPETENRKVFVKDFEIEITYSETQNCNSLIATQKIVYPGDTTDSIDSDYKYEINDGRYVSVTSNNCSGCQPRNIFYNTQGSVIEIQNYVEYEYDDNNVLKESIIYSNGSKENGVYIKHNYNTNGEKVSKVFYTDMVVRGDSIVFKDFVNGKPTKRLVYNTDNELNFYSEYEYDLNGNLISSNGSTSGDMNQFNFSGTYEYSDTYSRTILPLEGRQTPSIFEDATFFVEKPIRTKLEIFDLVLNRIDFKEEFLNYQEVNNKIIIESQYNFSNNNIYKRTLEFISGNCN